MKKFLMVLALALSLLSLTACNPTTDVVSDPATLGKDSVFLVVNIGKLTAGLNQLNPIVDSMSDRVDAMVHDLDLSKAEEEHLIQAKIAINDFRDYLDMTVGADPSIKDVTLSIGEICVEYQNIAESYLRAKDVITNHSTALTNIQRYQFKNWDRMATANFAAMQNVCVYGKVGNFDAQTLLGAIEAGVGIYTVFKN